MPMSRNSSRSKSAPSSRLFSQALKCALTNTVPPKCELKNKAPGRKSTGSIKDNSIVAVDTSSQSLDSICETHNKQSKEDYLRRNLDSGYKSLEINDIFPQPSLQKQNYKLILPVENCCLRENLNPICAKETNYNPPVFAIEEFPNVTIEHANLRDNNTMLLVPQNTTTSPDSSLRLNLSDDYDLPLLTTSTPLSQTDEYSLPVTTSRPLLPLWNCDTTPHAYRSYFESAWESGSDMSSCSTLGQSSPCDSDSAEDSTAEDINTINPAPSNPTLTNLLQTNDQRQMVEEYPDLLNFSHQDTSPVQQVHSPVHLILVQDGSALYTPSVHPLSWADRCELEESAKLSEASPTEESVSVDLPIYPSGYSLPGFRTTSPKLLEDSARSSYVNDAVPDLFKSVKAVSVGDALRQEGETLQEVLPLKKRAYVPPFKRQHTPVLSSESDSQSSKDSISYTSTREMISTENFSQSNDSLPLFSDNMTMTSAYSDNLLKPMVNLSPSSINLSPSSVNMSPSSVNMSPSSANLSLSIASQTPSANLSQSSTNLSPSSANLSSSSKHLADNLATEYDSTHRHFFNGIYLSPTLSNSSEGTDTPTPESASRSESLSSSNSCKSCEEQEIRYKKAEQRTFYNAPLYNVHALLSVKSDPGFFDTHCHLDFLFDRLNYEGVLSEFRKENRDTFPDGFRGCIAVFCNPFTFYKKKGLWGKHLDDVNVYGAFGCHPKRAEDYCDMIEMHLNLALDHKKVRALGEIGLDYSEGNRCGRFVQQKVFQRQLKMALNRKLPVVIHCRDANEDVLRIMQEILPHDYKIHLHCFTSDWEWAERWLEAFPNLFIGITNLVTYHSAEPTHQVARNIPLNKLLLETDAPYFIPRLASRSLKRSHPGLAIHVAAQVAVFKKVSLDEVLHETRKNTFSMYGV